ncbi:MAG: Gfo/Idh/MocA family protein [Chthoniobacterales bacterium]
MNSENHQQEIMQNDVDSQAAGLTRRGFLHGLGGFGALMGIGTFTGSANAADAPKDAQGNVIPGFEASKNIGPTTNEVWTPFSDRKLRVGIAGYGICAFGAAFGFQNHPNVEVVAVTDLCPDRCAQLAKRCGCKKTYPSCEEMLKDDSIEAVFIATDAPSHARLAIMALEHGKHVAAAVPAVFGSLEDAENLFQAVKKSGLKYMMFETSCFHADLYALRQQFLAGNLGKVLYSEGEYFHYFPTPLEGYNPETKRVDINGWRKGLPPQWYPTHSNAYYNAVTGGRFTEVSCLGIPSSIPHLQPQNNNYKNPFGTEAALFRTSDGSPSRMVVSWDISVAGGERGRVYGEKSDTSNVNRYRPPIPPSMSMTHHGGSHGYLTNEFVESVLLDRQPWIDIALSLNMTVPGIVAHESALKNGEWLKIPQYIS